MRQFFGNAAVLVAVLSSPWLSQVDGQVIYVPRHGSYWESQLHRQLDVAERTLESATKARREAAQKVSETLAAAQAKDRDYKQTTDDVRAEYEQSPVLTQARKDLLESKRHFEETKAAELKKLSESAAYAAALENRRTLSEQLRALPRNSESSESRRRIAKLLADAMSDVSRLEAEALASSSEATQALQQLQEATARVAELASKRDREFTADSRVRSARLVRQRTQWELQQAQRQLLSANIALTQAERVYQTLVQQRLAWERYERAQHWRGWGGWSYPRPW